MVIDTNPAPTVSREQWLSALNAHRKKEKALTAQLDVLAAERRRLPRERVDGDYEFDTPGGRASLSGLFDGRSHLIVYHHMLKPGDNAPCSGCCMFGDQIPHLRAPPCSRHLARLRGGSAARRDRGSQEAVGLELSVRFNR